MHDGIKLILRLLVIFFLLAIVSILISNAINQIPKPEPTPTPAIEQGGVAQ